MQRIEWHFATPAPEWAAVPPRKRNSWQRLAASTKGMLTPGNITSAAGVSLVIAGLSAMWQEHLWTGLALIALGRLGDLLDGAIAHKTGTKSPLGEAVDATCDKIGAFATLVVFAGAGLLWWPAALLIGLQNLINALIALIAKRRKYGLHPLVTGKIATAGEWIALLGFALTAALSLEHTSELGIASYTILGVSLTLGGYATLGYARLFWTARQRSGTKS